MVRSPSGEVHFVARIALCGLVFGPHATLRDLATNRTHYEVRHFVDDTFVVFAFFYQQRLALLCLCIASNITFR